jgi:Mn-dependent DtxR family transcriptional regulator
MAQERLRELLARVHERLKGGGHKLDADARRQLDTVMNDIDRHLDDANASVAGHTPRLESLAVRLEVSHPAVAETLRELADALVKAGI